MLNFKKNTVKESVAKSRSKSIYRGDQSHTVSMNIRIDHDLSPEIQRQMPPNQQKNYQKENKAQRFRESLKIMESSYSGKKTHREDLYRRSQKKIVPKKAMETERFFKQSNLSSRKSIIAKPERSIPVPEKEENKRSVSRPEVAVTVDEMKDIQNLMIKLAEQNARMRKQISFYQQQQSQSNNGVSRVLRY